jgi:predicted PurR-regulated permease PerM
MADGLFRIWQNVYLRTLLIALGLVLLFVVLGRTQLAWRSFLIAFLVAYLVDPFLLWLERRKVRRSVGVALAMSILVVLVVVAMFLLSRILIDLAQLPVTLGQMLTQIPDWLQSDAPAWLQNLITRNQQDLIAFWDRAQRNLVTWLEANANGLVNSLLQGTQGFLQSLFNLFILFVFIGFTVAGFPVIRQSLHELFPKRRQPVVKELAGKLDSAVGGYCRAKVLEATIMFFIAWLVLSLLGVPNAAALGLINALLNPVPYVGPLISTLIETLMALTVSWQLALVVLVVMIVIEQLDGNLLGPMLLSKGVDVHPVAILSAVIVGGGLLGLWGVLLSIPMVAFLQLLYRDYYKTSDWYQRKA